MGIRGVGTGVELADDGESLDEVPDAFAAAWRPDRGRLASRCSSLSVAASIIVSGSLMRLSDHRRDSEKGSVVVAFSFVATYPAVCPAERLGPTASPVRCSP